MPCAPDVKVEAEIHYFILRKQNSMLGEDLSHAKYSLSTFLYSVRIYRYLSEYLEGSAVLLQSVGL